MVEAGGLFKKKKSEIHNRAKRLLGAFANEERKRTFSGGHKKVIRAQYENGLLLLKEDILRLSYLSGPAPGDQIANQNHSIFWSQTKAPPPIPIDRNPQSAKEKLHLVVGEIVQMYSLQFKIVDELLGILKTELQKF